MAVGAVLSVFRNTESRYLKMLDFPRIQFFIASFVNIVLLAVVTKRWQWFDSILVFAVLAGMVVNGRYLINYTPLVTEAVPTANTIKASDERVGLLLVNVKMSNRNANALIDLIEKKGPDLILAMEVNPWWEEKLRVIEKDYPYAQETINKVAYGMTLYSKYPLKEITVDYLQNNNVPSFESTITLTGERRISFHSIHPVPPVHFKDLPDNAGQQETALKKLGAEIEDRNLPTIVAGDLNDVVWSHVDELTGTNNILNDVRVGRGFYNSYNAESFVMRWPLDHVFVTKEFRVAELERLPKIGSDHFPIYVELVL